MEVQWDAGRGATQLTHERKELVIMAVIRDWFVASGDNLVRGVV